MSRFKKYLDEAFMGVNVQGLYPGPNVSSTASKPSGPSFWDKKTENPMATRTSVRKKLEMFKKKKKHSRPIAFGTR